MPKADFATVTLHKFQDYPLPAIALRRRLSLPCKAAQAPRPSAALGRDSPGSRPSGRERLERILRLWLPWVVTPGFLGAMGVLLRL